MEFVLKWAPLRIKIIFTEKCSSLLFSNMNDDNKLECFASSMLFQMEFVLKWASLRVKIIFTEKHSSLLFSDMNDNNKLECFASSMLFQMEFVLKWSLRVKLFSLKNTLAYYSAT
jgi:hypothetical protein